MGQRALGLSAALLVEALLVLLLLTLDWSPLPHREEEITVVPLSAKSVSEDVRAPQQEASGRPAIVESSEPTSTEPKPTIPRLPRPEPTSSDVPFILLPTADMAAADISKIKPQGKPAAQTGPKMGPPDTGTPGDTPRVGTAPNGEPLYAASWYREPYDSELRGYLSTAAGPGWGLIACRTAPDFRVEDCLALDEHPSGSSITRAVLAAAWQFRVRPPRRGGQVLVGAWVRIRIEYDLKSS
jgi:periplasmic protein TonB